MFWGCGRQGRPHQIGEAASDQGLVELLRRFCEGFGEVVVLLDRFLQGDEFGSLLLGCGIEEFFS